MGNRGVQPQWDLAAVLLVHGAARLCPIATTGRPRG
jgi:hypothetical protein